MWAWDVDVRAPNGARHRVDLPFWRCNTLVDPTWRCAGGLNANFSLRYYYFYGYIARVSTRRWIYLSRDKSVTDRCTIERHQRVIDIPWSVRGRIDESLFQRRDYVSGFIVWLDLFPPLSFIAASIETANCALNALIATLGERARSAFRSHAGHVADATYHVRYERTHIERGRIFQPSWDLRSRARIIPRKREHRARYGIAQRTSGFILCRVNL